MPATDWLQKFLRDRDATAYERLVEAHRPLVASVCRRVLRNRHDVDDAVQETFLKLIHHAGALKAADDSAFTAWLTATARSTSVDLIRRAVRERARRQRQTGLNSPVTSELDAQTRAKAEAIRIRLYPALLALDPAARDLLEARFVRAQPLRVIALERCASIPTISRRVAAALSQLTQVLRNMGVADVDDRSVSEQFGDPAWLLPAPALDSPGLRFATDWRSPELAPFGTSSPTTTPPLRVGVFVSYASLLHLGANGHYIGTHDQVQSTLFFNDPSIRLVGIVEPNTTDRGVVEGTLRDYSLVAGLIEADDADALRTLDVILLGINSAMPESTADAIVDAVRSGVGLLNEYWTAEWISQLVLGDAARELLLAASPVYAYHVPERCGTLRPATVVAEHPLLPGLQRGAHFSVRGCGPAYHPRADAQLLIVQDEQVPPEQHGISGAGPLPLPRYLVGHLGRGRVVVSHIWPSDSIAAQLSVDAQTYLTDLLKWLAAAK